MKMHIPSKISSKLFSAMLILCCSSLEAQQQISLDSCLAALDRNYPALKNRSVFRRILSIQRRNANIAYYPQLGINGQATYQSDVTRIPIEVPGKTIEPLSKDQYKLFAELNQVLFDGGQVSAQKGLLETGIRLEQQKTEVEVYKVKDQLATFYFNALLASENIKITTELMADLKSRLERLLSGVRNGVVLQAQASMMKVEILKLEQKQIELQSGKKSLTEAINLLTGLHLTEDVVYLKPALGSATESNYNKRPEWLGFEIQQSNFLFQQKLSRSRAMPRLGLFAQGGYGRPALNMLDNSFKPYYIGGVRLNWNLSSLFTLKEELRLHAYRAELLNYQRETLENSLDIQANQQKNEIEKLLRLLEKDVEIIKLRAEIRKTLAVQLDAGTITAAEYLSEATAEEVSKQNKVLHEIQLLMAQNQLQLIKGTK